MQCSIAGVASSRETQGHRLAPSPIPVTGGDAYEAALHAHFVLANREARRAEILAQLHQAAANLGATVGALSLVDEVVDLVEWPSVIPAVFDADLLKLPSRLLVESMSVHQRVFPLFAGGVLLNRFLVVTNHPFVAEDAEAADIVARGNTKVLASRFYDARFFYAEDRKKTLAEHGQGLHKMRWIRDGGTMADKQDRVRQLASALAPRFGADPARAARAGALCKSDLTSQMVGEFPELQGHVGRLLAAHDGEDATVAQAIEEHYLPRFSGDALPACPEGSTVAITDRLDSLVGCFSRGLRPKASADPGPAAAAGPGWTCCCTPACRSPCPSCSPTPAPERPPPTSWTSPWPASRPARPRPAPSS